MILYQGNRRMEEFLSRNLEFCYNADVLKKYVSDIWRFVSDAEIIGDGAFPLDRSKYFPKTSKVNNMVKAQTARLCALIHSNPENLRQLLAKMPEYVTKALKMILISGCVGESRLYDEGIADEVTGLFTDSYSNWSVDHCRGKYLGLLQVLEGKGHEEYGEFYFSLPSFLRECYWKVLFPELKEDSMFVDELPGDRKVFSAENEFFASFPAINASFFQGKANVKDYKITTASSSAILKGEYDNGLIPKKFKVSVGQYFLPVLYKFIGRKKNLAPEECVKGAFKYFDVIFSNTFLPAMLPHIKGFKSNVMVDCDRILWGNLIVQELAIGNGKWLDIEKFRDCMLMSGERAGECPLKITTFFRMPLQNKVTGKYLFPDTLREDIDLEVIRAIAVGMYGLGMVELGVEAQDREYVSPCERVTHIRLTDLGRYALGLTARYEMKQGVGNKVQFKLDSDYLIISVSDENSACVSIISDIAVSIGGGRYRVDSSSFLKNCKTEADVDEKIKYFKQFICADLPEIWKNFFDDLKRRSKPFIGEPSSYIMMKIEEGNAHLAKILTSDAEIRPLILLVEGYRLLVREQDFDKFKSLMKSYGYLV